MVTKYTHSPSDKLEDKLSLKKYTKRQSILTSVSLQLSFIYHNATSKEELSHDVNVLLIVYFISSVSDASLVEIK